MSFRVPVELRDRLEAAAKESTTPEWNISQEAIHRLKRSFDQDAKDRSDPATRALCFLFAELAVGIHGGGMDWRYNPFLFRAFSLGVSKILEALEPEGEIKAPKSLITFKALAPHTKSPAKWAQRAVDAILFALSNAESEAVAFGKAFKTIDIENWAGPENRVLKELNALGDMYYGMRNASDALIPKGAKYKRKPQAFDLNKQEKLQWQKRK
jgi:hypothetical protein